MHKHCKNNVLDVIDVKVQYKQIRGVPDKTGLKKIIKKKEK